MVVGLEWSGVKTASWGVVAAVEVSILEVDAGKLTDGLLGGKEMGGSRSMERIVTVTVCWREEVEWKRQAMRPEC